MVYRELSKIIGTYLFKNKTIIIYGARQVGKTTLVENLVKDLPYKTLFLNGDDADIRNLLSGLSAVQLRPVLADNGIVVIDEAQRIPEIGLVLKLIHDNYKNIQLIATGSSALDLAGKIKEPMTGRKLEFFLHPLSFAEMVDYHGFLNEKRLLEQRLIFGYYPDIAMNPGMEVKLLKSLTSSFLYKDLLILDSIQKPVLLEKILQALALQIGQEVSFHELAQLLNSDKGTIEKYIDLLEKTYIIFRLNGLNRNVRNEIKKGRKIYFFDNGIRNAIIGNFLPLSSRMDTGALWENFLVSERFKFMMNSDKEFNRYFWRTTQQQEIDYIEELEGKFYAFEFKWNPLRKAYLSKTFSNAYPIADFQIITPENMHLFLTTQA
jgi:uncharacterized protein